MTKQKTQAEKRAQTQWSAQFLAAAELVRRGYTIAFTMGNHTPDADLAVIGPGGNSQFLVDVKGLASKSAWLLKPKKGRPDIYYILVHVGHKRDDDRFFILTNKQAHAATDWFTPKKGKGWQSPGFSFGEAEPYANKWLSLPK